MSGEMKYELLIELSNMFEADLLKSYLNAHGVEVEMFQESVGRNAYPVTLNALGRVQVFAPKSKWKQAKKLLENFNTEE